MPCMFWLTADIRKYVLFRDPCAFPVLTPRLKSASHGIQADAFQAVTKHSGNASACEGRLLQLRLCIPEHRKQRSGGVLSAFTAFQCWHHDKRLAMICVVEMST